MSNSQSFANRAPGMYTETAANHRLVTKGGEQYLPGNWTISALKSRDPGNTPVHELRAGLIIGRITSGGKLAPAILGTLAGACLGTDVTLSVSAAVATEIVRRIGATGTFKLTGPAAASGTVRTLTVTYSAVNTTTGDITVTAIGVNEVQTLNFTNSPAGTFAMRVKDSSGVWQTTQRITYSATIGTLLSNIQAALDAVLASNAIVASGSVVTAVALTFSGTGYAGVAQDFIVVDRDALTAGDVDVTRTTTGVAGAFVAGSFVQPTDGSESPVTILPNGYPIRVTDADGNNTDLQIGKYLVEAEVISANLINWPSDTSLRSWIVSALNAVGHFVFDHLHGL